MKNSKERSRYEKYKAIKKNGCCGYFGFCCIDWGATGFATVQKNKLSDLYSQVSTWEKTGRTYTTNENCIGYSVVELSTENIFEVPASLPITATDYENGVLVDYDGNGHDFQVTWTTSGSAKRYTWIRVLTL